MYKSDIGALERRQEASRQIAVTIFKRDQGCSSGHSRQLKAEVSVRVRGPT